MAQDFAISSLAEAAAYLAHPVLGPRLRTCTELVNATETVRSKRYSAIRIISSFIRR